MIGMMESKITDPLIGSFLHNIKIIAEEIKNSVPHSEENE
jgi:hypothetical protein